MTSRTGAPTAAAVGTAAAGKAEHLARLGIETRHVTLPVDDLRGAVDRADVAFVDPDGSLHHVLPALAHAGVPVWVDLADWNGEQSVVHAPFVEAATCLFLSDIELDDPLRTAERLLPGKELVVITHGKRGATAFFPDTEPFFVLPHDAGPVVDVGGVRDAFCSGVAYGFLQGWDWPRALGAGAVVAGGCVTTREPVDPALTVAWLTGRLEGRP